MPPEPKQTLVDGDDDRLRIPDDRSRIPGKAVIITWNPEDPTEFGRGDNSNHGSKIGPIVQKAEPSKAHRIDTTLKSLDNADADEVVCDGNEEEFGVLPTI